MLSGQIEKDMDDPAGLLHEIVMPSESAITPPVTNIKQKCILRRTNNLQGPFLHSALKF